MFCSNCGNEICENSFYCKNCDKKSACLYEQCSGIISHKILTKNEYIIQTAKKSMYRNVLVLFGEVCFLIFSIVLLPLIKYFFLKNTLPDIKTLNPEEFNNAFTYINNTLSVISIEMEVFLVITRFVSFASVVLELFRCLKTARSELYFTNKRLIGNTGAFWGNSILNVPFSQISKIETKTLFGLYWTKSGVISIKTSNNITYSFFIKYPYSFQYDLKEQISKSEKINN